MKNFSLDSFPKEFNKIDTAKYLSICMKPICLTNLLFCLREWREQKQINSMQCNTAGYCVILQYTFMLHHNLFSSVMEGKERNTFVKSITIRKGWSFQVIKLEVNEYPSCSWDWSHPFILQAKLFTVKTSSYSPYNKQYANRFWQDKN